MKHCKAKICLFLKVCPFCLGGLAWWFSSKRICLPRQEMWVQSLRWEDPLENGMATHSSVLGWEIPWTEEPSRLQSMRSRRVRHDLLTTPTAHEHAAIQMRRRRSHSLEAEHHCVILGLLSKYHRLCGFNNRNLFFPQSGG